MIPTCYANLAEACTRHSDRIERYAALLLMGDPLADDAVAALSQVTPTQARKLVTLSLENGIAAAAGAPIALKALFEQLDDVPFWVDWEQLNLGAATFMRSGFGSVILWCYSLPLAYSSPAGNKPLVFSGRLVGRAARRLIESGRFLLATCQPDGLRRYSPGFKSTVSVRLMHAQVRRLLMQSGRWKTDAWGAPINQCHMAGTNLLFSLIVLDGLQRLGFRFSHEERESVLQLWRYSGYLSGIVPDLLCATESEARRLADLILSALHALDGELKQGRQAESAVQERVGAACDGLAAALDRHIQDGVLLEAGYDDLLAFRDTSQIRKGLGGYVFRETFPLFMASATIARCYMKPRGYPEDFETVEMIYGGEPEGDTRTGRCIDRWFLSLPLCRGRRNARRLLAERIREAEEASLHPGAVPVTSLASGAAREIFDVLAGKGSRIRAACIDTDSDALLFAARLAREQRSADRVTFIQADVLDITSGQGMVSLEPQQLIYALGLCEYLDDAEVVRVLDWAAGQLREGGRLVLCSLGSSNPNQAFMEHILEWTVRERDESGVRGVFERSRLRGFPLELRTEDAGAYTIAICIKTR